MAGTLRSSASVSAAVLASRVLGVVRDSIFAAHFGVSPITDAFVLAFRIPNLLRDLFAEGALSSAFVPTFADAMARGGRERAFQLGNLVLGGVLMVTGLLTLVGIALAVPIVSLFSSGFDGNAEKLAHAARFAQVMMPILTLVSVAALWMGMLNAQQRFTAPAFAPALFNVTSIITGAALMITGTRDAQGMLLWSAGTTLGGLLQAVVQLPSLWRLGYRPGLAMRGLLTDPGVRRIVSLMAPACIGLAALQINILVNTQFAAKLGDNPLTYLNNAFRLFYLPVGLFGVALATVTTARASADAARGDRGALVARVSEGAAGVWLLALPSAVGLIVLAEPVIAVLFEWGKFLPEDTAAMVPIVRAYMLGVLPYSLVKVYSPAFYAVDRPRLPMLASMLAVAANVLFNTFTYQWLKAPGLALGTTLAALVNLAVLRLAFSGSFGRPTLAARGLGGLLLANAAMGVLVGALWVGVSQVLGAVVQAGAPRFVHALVRAFLLFITIGIGAVAYLALARTLRVPGADELARLPGKIARRLRGAGPRT